MPEITIEWPAERNEHGRPLRWFGSWLVDDGGVEGPWFYSGHGGARQSCAMPPEAIGLRIRRWPNEGLDAEYADIVPINGVREVHPGQLNFDVRQDFSLLPVEFI